jgi:hypothetical protein
VGVFCVLFLEVNHMTTTPSGLVHLGVKLPQPLALALKSAAAQRGTTASNIVRDALARDLAQIPNKKPARPA